MDLKILYSPQFILSNDATDETTDIDYGKILIVLCDQLDLKNKIKDKNLRTTINEELNNNASNYTEWLRLGIVALHLFIQHNWTGPPLKLLESIVWLIENRNEEALRELTLGDQCNDNAEYLELLYLTKIIFTNGNLQKAFPTSLWWVIRSNYIHQMILDEESDVLLNETELFIDRMSKLNDWNNDEYKSFETLFYIEALQFTLLYKRINDSEKYLKQAQTIAKLTLELGGAQGKRTKYQQEEKPQLFLNIKAAQELFPFIECPDLPHSVHIMDDLRLDSIEFSEKIEICKLGSIEEAVILATYTHLQISQPKDDFSMEELMPYLNVIIEGTKNWALIMEALRQRSIFEMKDKRGIERALSQTESLVGQYSQSKPSVFHRTNLLFASGMKTIWIFKQNLADSMLNLGLVKGALNLYLQLKLWEEVIVCYTILDLRNKAAEIIRQELSKKPTVKLWCLLGDAELDVNHYETAWELSDKKSSRAQKHWGFFYFEKKQYAEAIPHLELSVKLNNIQERVWIRLGFAALQIENWELSAHAYRRYCELEQTNFEAWNNLAKVYIKLNNKPRAWHSLKNAVKCDFNVWQVWDNLMVVSIDLGHFTDVIECYHRILDLKKSPHIDHQVLKILTDAITKNINDSEGQPVKNIFDKALALFGHINASVPNDPEILQLYAELTVLQATDTSIKKATEYLQRAYRSFVADSRWHQSIPTAKNVLQLCLNLADTYLRCSETTDDIRKKPILASAKLSLQSVLTTIEQKHLIDHEDIAETVGKLQNKLDIIKNELIKIDSNA
ncbi:tetratricopeptide repeat protein 27-like [Cotesia typhae]